MGWASRPRRSSPPAWGCGSCATARTSSARTSVFKAPRGQPRSAAHSRWPPGKPARTPMVTPLTAQAQWRVLLVDDHPLTRHGLAQLIAQQPDLVVCAEAGSAEDALKSVRGHQPNLVLVDVILPGKPGLELIKDLTTMFPEVAVL